MELTSGEQASNVPAGSAPAPVPATPPPAAPAPAPAVTQVAAPAPSPQVALGVPTPPPQPPKPAPAPPAPAAAPRGKQARNPAIKTPTPGVPIQQPGQPTPDAPGEQATNVPHSDAPQTDQKNEDGFTPGQDVNWDELQAHRQREAQRRKEQQTGKK
jgi:hypothetical protein